MEAAGIYFLGRKDRFELKIENGELKISVGKTALLGRKLLFPTVSLWRDFSAHVLGLAVGEPLAGR